MSYDKFQPLMRLNKIAVTFKPSSFIVWEGGKQIDGGPVFEDDTTAMLYDGLNSIDFLIDKDKYDVQLGIVGRLSDYVAQRFKLDSSFTMADRWAHVRTVREQKGDSQGMVWAREIIGITDYDNFLYSGEPYMVAWYFESEQITKISFHFNNPELLIEVEGEGDLL
ncbi:hypothetical protein [Botryobacter ruber]|uniref:hypothetical protein n=1 Tax=Botryobacter ruber TaxID=2171629 RepID=UPI000E0B54D7|nr:hypothetical protein [Botryobacter ruber]